MTFMLPKVEDAKTEEVDTQEKESSEEMRQAQAYLESVGGGPHTIGKNWDMCVCYLSTTLDVTADKDLIASAQAFTKTSARYLFHCGHFKFNYLLCEHYYSRVFG